MHQLYLCLSSHGRKKRFVCLCQITWKFQAEIVPYTRKQEGQLLEKTAGTDIIAHETYGSKEKKKFPFSLLFLLAGLQFWYRLR